MATIAALPHELLGIILLWAVRCSRYNKNAVIPLRLVCKAFDLALKPYVCKTIQLEFSKLLTRSAARPHPGALEPFTSFCQALYIDMMVVRDEDEIARLTQDFEAIAQDGAIEPLLASLRQYSMNDTTFDEVDYRDRLNEVLIAAPNIKRLKLTLPFQVLGKTCLAATRLLTATMKGVAARTEEDYATLETFVLDHLADTTVMSICRNHIDVGNIAKVFSGLKHLVISIRKQEGQPRRQEAFHQNFWFLIYKATKLESFCLTGWNLSRNKQGKRVINGLNDTSFVAWHLRCFYYKPQVDVQMSNLRFLELNRIVMDSKSLISLIKQHSASLKELYLINIYLKAFQPLAALTNLWIGFPDVDKSDEAVWVAPAFRTMEGLKLDVLRATGLGYDIFDQRPDSLSANWDLIDPSGKDRTIDERFVEAVLGNEVSKPPTGPNSDSASIDSKEPVRRVDRAQYDARRFQHQHNTTSHFKSCIDGLFANNNDKALWELERIIKLADRGILLLDDEVNRSHALRAEQLQ